MPWKETGFFMMGITAFFAILTGFVFILSPSEKEVQKRKDAFMSCMAVATTKDSATVIACKDVAKSMSY